MLRRLNHFTSSAVDPTGNVKKQDNEQGEISQKQVEEYLETFELDEFGRNGIQMRADDDNLTQQ